MLVAKLIVDELGKGAFSIVKSATRKADGQKSAVKVVERRKLGKGDLEALRSEAKLLDELDHPNIVKLHGWYEEDKTLYMALELCEGERKTGLTHMQDPPVFRGVWPGCAEVSRGLCLPACLPQSLCHVY